MSRVSMPMKSEFPSLRKYLRRPVPRRLLACFLLGLPVLAFLSLCLGSGDLGLTPEHPGGTPLEIAFWLSSFGAAVVAFAMVEILFRGEDVQVLATLPVPTRVMRAWLMRRVWKFVGLSTILYAACWVVHIPRAPAVMTLCIALWPMSLILCAEVASASILYTGDKSARDPHPSPLSAMAFSTAPAIALAVSLLGILLLKLLAEALLKPGFFHAALTATAILGALMAICGLYARHLFLRRYYGILAGFLDADRVVINAEYDFLDDRLSRRLRSASPVQALRFAMAEQFRRRHALSTVLLVTLILVLCLVTLSTAPENRLFSFACLAMVPLFLFFKPWTAMQHSDFTDALAGLPVSPAIVRRASVRACFDLVRLPLAGIALCVAVTDILAFSILKTALDVAVILASGLTATAILSVLASSHPKAATVVNYLFAVSAAILAFIL